MTLSTPAVVAVLVVYATVMLAVTRRWAGPADAEAFVVADRDVPFALGAATMSATWIWAASMYAAATAGYTYGPAGALHYAVWGGAALLFVWRYGQRVRALAAGGHTFPEWIRARHGRMSQAVIAVEGYLNSQYSLVLNLTAGAALVSLVSPLSYGAALALIAVLVLAYSMVSGIRASVATDVVQMGAMVLVAAVAVPTVVGRAGGPSTLLASLRDLGPSQGSLWSIDALLGQGLPMMALILAYAFANPTVWQRVFAVRGRDLARVYVTSGVTYMVLVAAVGALGVVALATGLQPADGDLNTLVPAVAGAFLPAWMVVPFVVLIVAAITSTSDSDLAALSSFAMVDLWRGVVRPGAGDAELKAVGRVAMVAVTAVAVAVATLRPDILTLILLYGMIRAASVFPIAASIVWDRVSNVAFTAGVLVGIALGVGARVLSSDAADAGNALVQTPALGMLAGALATVGAATMVGCLAYPFVRLRAALALGAIVGTVAGVLQVVNAPGLLTYPTLLSTLVALGTGTVVCVGATLLTGRQFDWASMETAFPSLSATEA